MKKFFVALLALVLCLSLTAVAFAADDQVHNGTLPYTSEQNVKITITGLHVGGDNDGSQLPSEYHVRVKWDVLDGVYNATATDTANGFKNFSWDCVTLQYKVNKVAVGSTDTRSGNWSVKPKVKFEVTNASTPDLSIKATPSLKGTNNWAGLLLANTIETQNTTIGTQTISPVLYANMGTGVNSYEQNNGAASHNVYAYEYTLNWDYDALNQKALDSFAAGSGTQSLTNTFVLTIATGN